MQQERGRFGILCKNPNIVSDVTVLKPAQAIFASFVIWRIYGIMYPVCSYLCSEE